ncbi:hypothetical protein BG22_09870 [Bifidobacterium sp. UTBIF-78]|nr:hypothetical protein BG22_09870 [Bifidobacterium sp. UTBIF-78]
MPQTNPVRFQPIGAIGSDGPKSADIQTVGRLPAIASERWADAAIRPGRTGPRNRTANKRGAESPGGPTECVQAVNNDVASTGISKNEQ